MARAYYINGQALVSYKGQQLGLTDGNGRVTVRPNPHYLPIQVDGFFDCPPERQATLIDATITMTLVHFDIAILEEAMAASTQGASEGVEPQGGVLVGANGGYGTLLIASPGPANNPFTFPNAYIRDSYELPLGAERSLLQLTWHAVAYVTDPWNGGQGSQGLTCY